MYNDKMGSIPMEISGNSLDDCKATLYKKYKSNYQITGYKTELKGGFLGMFQREVVHVSYILVNQTDGATNRSAPRPAVRPESYAGPAVSSVDSFTRNRDEILKKADASVTNTLQLAKIQETMERLSDTVADLKNFSKNADSEKPASIQKIEELLELNEFTPSYVKKISDRIRNEFSLDELEDFEKVQTTVVDWIGESIQIAPDVVFRPPHVVIIVGPTGVGKTTTLAKMSSNFILSEKKKNGGTRPVVRLITIDNWRVGAAQQLEHYGSIMDTEVKKAETCDDVKKIFTDYRSSTDAFYIDTSGFSPNDYEHIARMRAVLDVPGLKPDMYLAVSASTKARDLETIIRNYESFNFRSVIITKCDETSSMGNVLSVLSEKGKAISFVTDGQQVPRYIEKADRLRFLLNLEGFHIDREHLEDKFGVSQDI